MNRDSESRYMLTERIFQNNGTYVSYPVIISGDSEENLNVLNEIIIGDVNKILSLYDVYKALPPAGGKDLFLGNTLNMGYEIKRNDEDYLSIFYTADFFSPYGAYPTQSVYTTNIDLQNLKRLKLADITAVNDTLLNEFLSWQPVGVNPQYIQGIRDYIEGLGAGTLKAGFASADIIGPENILGIFSYLKPDRIGISISLPIYLGNHAEFEKEYETGQN